MKPLILLLSLLIPGLTLYAQTSSPSDTTFLLREGEGDAYHAIFIDTNKTSLYYDYITSFQFDDNDSVTYASTLDCLQPFNSVAFNDTSFARQWNSLYSYKGKYYLYSPSDYANNIRIALSDSTCIYYSSQGPSATGINDISKIDLKTYRLSLHYCYTSKPAIVLIHIIDAKKGIAIFEYTFSKDGRYRLMVSADKAKNFPIIVNYSTQKASEFDFDDPDFKTMLKAK
jgi:hypothetical protein